MNFCNDVARVTVRTMVCGILDIVAAKSVNGSVKDIIIIIKCEGLATIGAVKILLVHFRFNPFPIL